MSGENVPVSREEYTALIEKLDGIEDRFAKVVEEQDVAEAAEFQDRLDKIEGTLDDLLKAEEDAGALIDGKTGVTEGDDFDDPDLTDEENEKKRKERSKGDLTSKYSQDADVVSTKLPPGEVNKRFMEDLMKKIDRLERGQAIIKGPGSEDLNDEQNAGSYMKGVIGAQYGFKTGGN